MCGVKPSPVSLALAGGAGTPPTLQFDSTTDAVISVPTGVYGVVGFQQLVGEPQQHEGAGALRRVTVTDLLQGDTCDDTLCELRGWQSRDLPLGRVKVGVHRLTLQLEDAARSQTRELRARLARRYWTVTYLVALQFEGGRTLRVLMYGGERNPQYRR